MPIKTYWYIKDKVIFMEMIDRVTEDEYAEMIRSTSTNASNSSIIHTIFSGEKLVAAHDSMPSMNFMSKQRPETSNQGWVVFIQHQNSAIGRFIVSITMQLIRLKFRFVNSFQEAIDILEQADDTLPSMKVPSSIDELEVINYIDMR